MATQSKSAWCIFTSNQWLQMNRCTDMCPPWSHPLVFYSLYYILQIFHLSPVSVLANPLRGTWLLSCVVNESITAALNE